MLIRDMTHALCLWGLAHVDTLPSTIGSRDNRESGQHQRPSVPARLENGLFQLCQCLWCRCSHTVGGAAGWECSGGSANNAHCAPWQFQHFFFRHDSSDSGGVDPAVSCVMSLLIHVSYFMSLSRWCSTDWHRAWVMSLINMSHVSYKPIMCLSRWCSTSSGEKCSGTSSKRWGFTTAGSSTRS